MKTIKAYQTSDGNIYDAKAEAELHQAALDIQLRLEVEPLYGDCAGSRVEVELFLPWLEANRSLIEAYLGALKK